MPGVATAHGDGLPRASADLPLTARWDYYFNSHRHPERPDAPPRRPGAALSAGTLSRPPNEPTVSAIVCTRGRSAMAMRAVASLVEQSVTEVIVVDNAPADDATARLVRDRAPTVRYVVEPRLGLDFARSRALHEARGDVAAFLDDDAIAAPGWADSLQRSFAENPGLGACTARVEALSLEAPGQRLFEANGGFSRGLTRVSLPTDASRPLRGRRVPLIAWAVSIGSGCSFALDRRLALELGGFDFALDRGDRLPGGGDLDMLWRILQAGRDVVYEPTALAYHEHRREVEAVFVQLAGHQKGLLAFLTKAVVHTRGRARLGVLAFFLWRLVKPGLRLAKRAVRRDPLPARAILRMWRHSLMGGPAYIAARLRTPDRETR